nr:PIN domain-containing protein [Candidatus Njordarchaeota archaeon]
MPLIDTSAWIEFFLKTEKGAKVKQNLETQSCYTSIISIAEISNWASRQKLDGRVLVRYAVELTQLVNINLKIAFLAGELNFQRKRTEKDWGMIDSIILATAQIYSLEILTKDHHFEDLSNAEIL